MRYILALMALASIAYAGPQPQYWDRDLIADTSGNGNTATNYGVSLSETPDGWTGAFEMAYLKLPPSTNLVFSDGSTDRPFSIEAQYLSRSNDYRLVSDYVISPATKNYELLVYAGEFRFTLYDGAQYTRKKVTSWPQDETIHVLVTYDGVGGSNATSGMTIYLNGVSVATGEDNSATYVAMNGTLGPITIGAFDELWAPAPSALSGSIDFVNIYNQCLTATDATNLYIRTPITNEPVYSTTMRPETR